jgi:chromosome partitioning protein
MASVIAVVNQKGGVGKTTIARELSGCLAFRGYRVLMIDCDPQANLTNSFVDAEQFCKLNLAHVLITPPKDGKGGRPPRAKLSDAIVETPVPNLDIVGGHTKLAAFEMETSSVALRLKSQLDTVTSHYHFVILDSPPHISKLQIEILLSADHVLIPYAASSMGLENLPDLIYTIDDVRNNSNPKLSVIGTVVNLYKPRRWVSQQAKEVVEEASETLGQPFKTSIHDFAEISESPNRRLPTVYTAPRSKAAQQIEALTDEFLSRLGMAASVELAQ